MNYKQAEKLIFENNSEKSSNTRDDLYNSEKGRLQNLITSSPPSLIKGHQESLEQLEIAYKILLQGPTDISLKPPVKEKLQDNIVKETVTGDPESPRPKKKQTSFLKALMSHWGVFFLSIGSLSLALLMAILWSGQKSELSEMEAFQSQNEIYQEILNNRPLNLVNMGKDTFRILAYTVFYFDEKENKIKKYYKEELSDDFVLKPSSNSRSSAKLLVDLTADKRSTAFDGNALFFSLVLQNKRTGKAQSWMDYVGEYDNEKGNINLNLQ